MSTLKKSGLGKGFGSLIPQDFDKSLVLDDGEKIRQIATSDIQPNPEQPRQHFDMAA